MRGRRLGSTLIGLFRAHLVAFCVFSAPVAVESTEEEKIRHLLRELWMEVPSREVTAPPFWLPDLHGRRVGLAEYEGRAVMFYFWTTY